MSRETDVVQSLVGLADNLLDDFDAIDLLTGVVERCETLLGVTAAGVMLANPRGRLRPVASSSDAMRVVEIFELQAREGPCLDAFHTGEQVAHENLRPGAGTWPKFAAAAVEAGFNSAFALPLRVRETTIGALNLFSAGLVPMAEEDVLFARAFADMATITVLSHRADEASRVTERLAHILTSRIVIEQAKGVIFERLGVDIPDAFTLLRSYARSHNALLTDVARDVVEGTLDPTAWTALENLGHPTTPQ